MKNFFILVIILMCDILVKRLHVIGLGVGLEIRGRNYNNDPSSNPPFPVQIVLK